jgi:two-component system cell cycle sensor histidine kinase/response regulator CckA
VSVKSETSSLGSSPTNALDLAPNQVVRVLYVDDDLAFLKIAKQCLEVQGRLQVDTALSAEEGLEKLRKEEYDAVISDYQMRGKDGLEFLRELRGKGNFVPFIMFTGKGREEVAVKALNLGAANYVNKNGAPETVYAELAHDIHSVVERARAEESLLRSEEKYRSLVNNAGTAIAVTDLYGRLTCINRALIDLFGFSAQEMLGNPWVDFLHSEDRVRVQQLFQEIIMLRKEPRNFEFRGIRKDGCVLYLMTKPTKIETKGKTSGFQAIITDVSERKKAEEEVQRFSSAVKMSRDGVVITDLNGIIIDANDAAARFYRARQKNDLVGKNALDLVVPNEREAVLERMKEAAEKGSTELHQYSIDTGTGGKLSIELTTTAMKDREGKPYGFVSIVRDVTERKRTALSLAESEAKYRTLVEQSLQGIVVAQGLPPRLVFANPAMIRMSGYTSEELASLSLECLIHPEDRYAFFSRLEERLEGKGSAFDNECRAVRKDGKVVWIDVSSGRIQYNGQPAVQAAFIDVTERKKAELAVLESQEKFEGLFRRNPEAAVYVGSDFRILDINPRFEELFGYSLAEVKGMQIDGVVVPKDRIEEAQMLDNKAGLGYVYYDTVRRRKDGSLVPVAVSAAPITVEGQLVGYVGVYKDISVLKNAEEKLETMNEKLRVVGELTRHDVRNKLSTITGNIYLSKKKLPEHTDVLERFKEMELACEQIVRIFNFAKDYEMLGAEELTYIDVENAVQKAVSLFSDLKGVKIANQSHGLTVLADTLLRQLFYNLIDNSLRYGVKISQIRIHYGKTEGKHLRLVYQDDGVGIAQTAKPKLFQEGYTTSNGSGHGLYLIKKMTEVYGWTIEENGQPGRGAKFVITVPRTNTRGKENYRILTK